MIRWDDVLKYRSRGHTTCPTCGKSIIYRLCLEECFREGHFNVITQADCSEPVYNPAPRSTMIYIEPIFARIVLLILALVGIGLGVLIGRLIR